MNSTSVKVYFPQFNVIVEVPRGTSILGVAQKAGIGIRSVCGGKGFCGKCKVLVKGRVEHKVTDKTLISDEEVSKGYVLACLAKVVDDIEVLIPPESQFRKAKLLSHVLLPEVGIEPVITKIPVSDFIDAIKISTFYRLSKEVVNKIEALVEKHKKVYAVVNSVENTFLDVVPDDTIYGVAVDIGTTKIVVALVDLSSGRVIDVDSEFNKQIMYGEDIISRISYALEKKEGLRELQKAVIDTINVLVERLCRRHGIESNRIFHVSVAGNTAMTYLFINLDPYPLIKSFKTPVKIDPKPYILTAHELKLNINKNALVYVLPCSGRFLGGDVIGDIITAGINISNEPTLLIDIGTNAEIVIGCKHWFIGTTAPAGPAFEGWGLKCGVRAVEGAIESIKIDPETLEPIYTTIGDMKPIGICGSGYIDVVAQLFINGVIDRNGKFYRNIDSPRVRRGIDGYEYVVVQARDTAIGKDIVVTEKDIYNIIDSKSSVCAGISILLKRVHLDVYGIKKVYVCGAFGRYLNVDSAMAIGMIPEFPNAEITYIGNGSLGGAILTMISRTSMYEAERVAKNIATLELMLDPNFMDEYEAGFTLPGKPELFPTWWKRSLEIKPWKLVQK